MKQGMVLAFRRHQCKDETICLKLRGLRNDANYEVSFEDAGTKKTISGEELASGIDVTINETPGSLLIIYQQI